jgi:hypothetical protein
MRSDANVLGKCKNSPNTSHQEPISTLFPLVRQQSFEEETTADKSFNINLNVKHKVKNRNTEKQQPVEPKKGRNPIYHQSRAQIKTASTTKKNPASFFRRLRNFIKHARSRAKYRAREAAMDGAAGLLQWGCP